MKFFIDGDAFPNLLKAIVLKAIEKYKLDTYVIANKKIDIGKSKPVKYLIVEDGLNKADDMIVELTSNDDLIITADIPLADRVVSKNAIAINHRGELYTEDNIKHYLAIRNLMQDIRDSGEMTKGPAPFSKKDVHNFATSLNNILYKRFH
ncbi:MAG: YaiI/YqxD family protein [Sphaerochaetaceae bacterium]|nr:YaiI/YqxD family protein [Sphaerochaetaceae bacterium]